ncbi:MAG: hypothetical protein NVSMB65_02810 [Chloroflexota bacterium]
MRAWRLLRSAEVSAVPRWWARLDRRALPGHAPPTVRWILAVALLLGVCVTLQRDVGYLSGRFMDDVFAYECYAEGFWHGQDAVREAPLTRLCDQRRFKFWTAPPRAFHTLPHEYPAPALALFSLVLLVPWVPYKMAFLTMMAGLVVGVTAWLAARGLLLCAAAFALYVLVAGWALALARYDLVPGVLTLGALVLAERRRVTLAYAVLAAATLLKLYPALLVPALAAHEWRVAGTRRWRGPVLFAALVAAGLLPAALLAPASILQPFSYNAVRPPQIESVVGSLLMLGGQAGGPLRPVFTFHSLNMAGPPAPVAAWVATALLLYGLGVAYRRAWQGRDTLGRSFVVVVLVALCGGKVLSPQYLLWLFPLAAYVDGVRLRWALLALLTLAIYPHGYDLTRNLVRLPSYPEFTGAVLLRNTLLVALAVLSLAPRPPAPAGLPRVSRRGGAAAQGLEAGAGLVPPVGRGPA